MCDNILDFAHTPCHNHWVDQPQSYIDSLLTGGGFLSADGERFQCSQHWAYNTELPAENEIQTSWALPSSWTIEASSSWDGNYGPDNVKEHSGRPWHSREDFPQHLIFDAGEVVAVNALATSQPPSGWGGSAMRGYTLFRSDNGEDWSEVTAGEGRNLAGGERQEIEFPVASARYWKLQIAGNHGYHRLVTTQYVEFRIGEPTENEQVLKPPPSCCLALEASCLACQALVTIEEFCVRSPLTQGCPIMPDVDQGDLATLHWNGGSFTIPAGQEGICLVRGPETFPNDLVDRVSGLRNGCEVDLYQHGCPGGRVGTITGLTSDQGGLLGLEITALSVTCHPVDPPVGLATVHWNGGFFTIPDEQEGNCLSRGSATFPNDQVASITDMRDGCTVEFYKHGCPGGRVGTITHVTEPRSDLFDLEITALTVTCQGNPTHYLTVVSWPAHAWGQWNDNEKGAIEKCSARESTTDEDGDGYLFTSCCTAEGGGMRRVCGSTRNTDFETAVEQCAAQGGRLCTSDEALSLDENNRGRMATAGQGCSVDGPRRANGGDMNRLWTSTPCSP
jgi:hypothetical protein